MSYYESAEGVTINKKRAIHELREHSVTDINEFFEEVGDKAEYDAQEVLSWLGY